MVKPMLIAGLCSAKRAGVWDQIWNPLYSDRRGTTHRVITKIIKAKTTKEAFKNEGNKDSNIGLSTSSRERKKKKRRESRIQRED